jgi:hypothetical protein
MRAACQVLEHAASLFELEQLAGVDHGCDAVLLAWEMSLVASYNQIVRDPYHGCSNSRGATGNSLWMLISISEGFEKLHQIVLLLGGKVEIAAVCVNVGRVLGRRPA